MVQLSGFEWLIVCALIAVLLALAAAACMVGLQRHMLFPASKPLAVPHSPHHLIHAIDIPVNGKVLRGHVAAPIDEPSVRRGLLYFNGRRENPRSIFRALSALPGHHVVEVKFLSVEAASAVLAGVVVALVDVLPREFYLFARQAVEGTKDNDRGDSDLEANRVDQV
jgi:hypothetical protein